MAGWTNRGKYGCLGDRYRGVSLPGGGYAMALFTAATAPGPDTNLFSDLTEIAAGNGYTSGGMNINQDATDFDVWTEDDVNDRALVQIKDLVWTAAGGTLPSSGGGARTAGLTDRHATLSAREVFNYFDLVSDRTVSDTQSISLLNCEIRLREP